jgi:uroporphyrinogen-III synthase
MFEHATTTSVNEGLRHKRILLTAPQDSAERMAQLVQHAGGRAVLAPLIARAPLPLDDEMKERLRDLKAYQWLVFTSAGAVERFFDEVEALAVHLKMGRGTIVAIGEYTAGRIERRGYRVGCVAEESRAEGVIEAMLAAGLSARDRVLFPSAGNARSYIPEELHKRGIAVDVLELYTIAPHTPSHWREIREALHAGLIDAVTFTSPSAARHFFCLIAKTEWQRLLSQPVICVIGKTTAAALCELGVAAPIVPEQTGAEHMIAALARHFVQQVKI